MCGRSSLNKTEKELEERFNAHFYSEDLERYNPLPNFNVAPSHVMPVLTNQDTSHFLPLRWGLIPFWAKDEKIGYKMINARLETILEKPAFRQAVEKRRCLVPFDGFFEWKKLGTRKIPYRITTTNTPIFSVAGIWEKWKSLNGTQILSFSLITREANRFMATIHDRMPAILLPENEQLWIKEDVLTKDALSLLQPYPDEYMNAYKVSPRVNNARNNDPELLSPADPTSI